MISLNSKGWRLCCSTRRACVATTSTVGVDPEVDRESYPSRCYHDAERSSGSVTHEKGSEPSTCEAAEGKWRDQRPVDGSEEDEGYRCHGVGESEDYVLDGVTASESLRVEARSRASMRTPAAAPK